MNTAAVLAAYLGTRRRRFTDRAELLAWQQRRAEQALARARRRFDYYRSLGSNELSDFPILDKAEWLERFAELNDRALSLEQCQSAARAAEAHRAFDTTIAGRTVGLSSGTSGRQGVFLTSASERARWAGTMLAKALPDGLLAGARVALVLRAGGPLYAAVDSRRVAFRYVDLYARLEQQVAELTAFQPSVLAAPPLLLALLAAERRAGRLRIDPRLIYSVADVLDADVAAEVEHGFGVAVGQIYQATEGFLGITCAHQRLHLNEDLLVIEAEPLGPGRFTPVITDLFRTSQAIIRYRLGDVLVEAEGSCACGSVMRGIAGIEGRTDDLLHLPSGDGAAVCFPDLIRAAVLESGPVSDFTVVQDAADRLLLAVSPDERFADAADALRRRLAAAGFGAVRIVQQSYRAPEPTAKRRRISRAY